MTEQEIIIVDIKRTIEAIKGAHKLAMAQLEHAKAVVQKFLEELKQ